MSLMSKHKLVLLGGGFAGTWLATHAVPAYKDLLEVILVSEEPEFTFSPLLINGLAGDLKPQQFTLNLTKLASERGFRFIQGTIDKINREQRRIHITQRNGGTIDLPYDSAVLATGAKANFFGIPGLEEASFVLKELADIDRLVVHLAETLIKASKAWTDEDKKRILSFVIVGGGPTGVELLGAMRERLRSLAYERGLEQLLPLIKITLVESSKTLFMGFPEDLCQKSEALLRESGIDVRCNTSVKGAKDGVATFADDSTIRYETLIWAAGVKPVTPPIEPAFPAGPLKTDSFLKLDEHLYGAGDAILHEQDGVRAPKNAQSALHMAHAILENVVRRAQGKQPVAVGPQLNAALITVLHSGFFRLNNRIFSGRWIHPFRKLLYRFRLWQIRTGH